MNKLYHSLIEILLKSTEDYKFNIARRFRIVPGWNDHVKNKHKIARHHFAIWRESGRPLEGTTVCDMKESRACFKNALNYCKDNEDEIRRQKIAESFISKNFKTFWKDVKIRKNGYEI